MATEKRARKKEFRDAQRAAYQARLRRRRVARVSLAVLALVVVGGLAIFSDTGEEGEDDEQPAAEETRPDEAACGAQAPPVPEVQQFESAPEQQLEEGVDYGAVIKTSCGDIVIDLLEKDAPVTVNNFVFLAREGFYDGIAWHRIQQNFVIQAGDPNSQAGDPPDDPGYEIPDELPDTGKVYTYGIVAMANAGPNSGGSQFFIVVHQGKDGNKKEAAGLTPTYSIFGVTDESSYEVVDEIATLEVKRDDPNPAEAQEPVTPVYIESVEITES